MTSFANITIAGHIGNDPELKSVGAKNRPCCNFSVAVNTGFGERETTTWWRVALWDNRAENAAKLLRKGTAVIISGEPQNRPYEKDGQQRHSLEIDGKDWSFASSKADNAPANSFAGNGNAMPAPTPQELPLNDDIPF